MKTILMFAESIDKRKIILKHPKDMAITIETRPDYYDWEDADGNPVGLRDYIVIRIPKCMKIQKSAIHVKPSERSVIGFHAEEQEGYLEFCFYNRITFVYVLYLLESLGIFRVTQRSISSKEDSIPFDYYINPRGFYQWSYNLFQHLVHLPWTLKQVKEFKN